MKTIIRSEGATREVVYLESGSDGAVILYFYDAVITSEGVAIKKYPTFFKTKQECIDEDPNYYQDRFRMVREQGGCQEAFISLPLLEEL